MAKKTKRIKRRTKKAKAKRVGAMLYLGLSPESAKEIVRGLDLILKMGKEHPQLAIEAVKALALAVEIKNATISHCQFSANPEGVGMSFEA